jgi:hypothetical protein
VSTRFKTKGRRSLFPPHRKDDNTVVQFKLILSIIGKLLAEAPAKALCPTSAACIGIAPQAAFSRLGWSTLLPGLSTRAPGKGRSYLPSPTARSNVKRSSRQAQPSRPSNKNTKRHGSVTAAQQVASCRVRRKCFIHHCIVSS